MPTKKALAVLADLSARLRAAFPEKIREVILHGSQLTGKTHDESDYDFVVVWDGRVDWQLKEAINHVAFDVGLERDAFIHPMVISEEDKHGFRGSLPVYANAFSQGLRAAA